MDKDALEKAGFAFADAMFKQGGITHLGTLSGPVEAAITAYLEAVGGVVVPKEPSEQDLAIALHDIDYVRGHMREGKQVFREFYRAMITASQEGQGND